jgi:hypothetical protein
MPGQIADAKRADERADKPQHEGPRHGVDLATELVDLVERFDLGRRHARRYASSSSPRVLWSYCSKNGRSEIGTPFSPVV